MPTDGFSKAKANSKPLQEFMATPEVSEWLEIEVRGKETKRTYFLFSLPILERVSQQDLPFSEGLDRRCKDSERVQRG